MKPNNDTGSPSVWPNSAGGPAGEGCPPRPSSLRRRVPKEPRSWCGRARLTVALVVEVSVGLKWILQEPDSHLAEALVRSEPDLLVPDFLAERSDQCPVAASAQKTVHA